MIRTFKLGLLALVGACIGCASFGRIPANSTPEREARYYRTRDVPNAVLGAGCNLIVGLEVRDTTPLASVARVGTCVAAGVVQRQLDRGYRESGALFVSVGAMAAEIARLFARLLRSAP